MLKLVIEIRNGTVRLDTALLNLEVRLVGEWVMCVICRAVEVLQEYCVIIYTLSVIFIIQSLKLQCSLTLCEPIGFTLFYSLVGIIKTVHLDNPLGSGILFLKMSTS